LLAHYLKSFFRDLTVSLRTGKDWSEVRYSLYHVWSDFIHPARVIVYGFRNLYAYLPIIWRDRNWDDYYFFVLMEKKFSRWAHDFELYSHHLSADRSARELRVCAALCRRINADEYHDHDQELHDKKWGKAKWVTLPKEDPEARSVTTRTIRRRVRNDADEKAECEEFLRWMKKGDEMKQDDINYLMHIIGKHVQTWWD